MRKWQDAGSGETGGGGRGGGGREVRSATGLSNPAEVVITGCSDEDLEDTLDLRQASPMSNGWVNNIPFRHPMSPQRSISSHDEAPDVEINSNQSLLVPNRERNKLSKSSSLLCSMLGRLSRSRPDMAQSLCTLTAPDPFGGSTLSNGSSVFSTTMRKCLTQATLTSPESPTRPLPIHPTNRLRLQSNARLICSRCSSLLSMASSSKYSVNDGRYVSLAEASEASVPTVLCKLCLAQVPASLLYTLLQCSCNFCLECTRAYVEFEINQGAYEISCPDAMCQSQGIISLREIENLASPDNYQRHLRFRRNREVDSDSRLAFCPGVGCDTICTVLTPGGPTTCPTCSNRFCSVCRGSSHLDGPCPRLAGGPPAPFLHFDSDLIKCCPMCSVPIEKDEGCAQMMCKRCKHVFCWYCLTSLDDDFLLRHYDKGPCKNKLGHSRASVIWHRTQVIGIFAGFGILLLVASPLLLLAAPCIVCCKCRVCSGGDSRLEEDNTAAAPATEAQQNEENHENVAVDQS